MNPVIALLTSVGIAVLAWRLRALTRDGAVAASLVGTTVLASTGWAGCLVLGVFFAGSSAISRIATSVRGAGMGEPDEVRDWRQVTANGGAAAIGALAEWWEPGLGLWLVTVALAAAAADTWATAFGALSPRPPRDIRTRALVSPGTSGGVTWLGTSGALMGAALVSLAGATTGGARPLYGVALVIGVLGMVIDSLLGSAAQARFRCSRCNVATERRHHRCGSRTTHSTGWKWLDNDVVNAIATVLAAGAGIVAWYWLSP